MHPFVKTTASVALAALLVAAGPALAIGRAEAQSRAPGRAELGRVQIPYERFTLPNGLTVLVYTDRTAPSVFVGVWYRIGSKDEPEVRTGFAHLFEHLMFQGTDDLAPGEFSNTVEAQGGNDNAFTSWDYTAYFQRVAADRLGLMMQMEAERMRDLILSEEDVATERQVIIEERSQRTDSNPGALLSEQMAAAQFLNHPYGIPVIGWRHEMETLTREDALKWYHDNYAPNNAVLVVAGDVTPAEVERLAKEYYGPLAPLGLQQQQAGDPYASEILARGLGYIQALLQRLQDSGATQIAMIGGLAPQLAALLPAALQQQFSQVQGPPEAGASALARQYFLEKQL